MPPHDVAIIGAGLSGLQAAIDLQNAGFSCIILEARDRVGGKTLSTPRPDGKGLQELGPAWVNDTNQSAIWAYCKQFGLSPVIQNVKGNVAFEDTDGKTHTFPYGDLPKFSSTDRKNIEMIRDKVQAVCLDDLAFKQPNRARLDSVSFEEWVRGEGGGHRAVQTVNLWCCAMLGQSAREVSALSFLEVPRAAGGITVSRSDEKGGAQYIRLKEGTSAIPVGMAGLLKPNTIKLNTQVTGVVQKGKSLYSISLAGGRHVTSRKVIVSVPSSTYKFIHFDPPLPPQRNAYNTHSRYGCYIKYLVLFRKPWWRDVGSCGLAQSFRGPVSLLRDTSIDDQDNYALTCFIGSEPGRKWHAMPPQERQESVLKQMAHLYQVPEAVVRDNFIDTLTSPWMEDQWAGWGCPFSATPPGVMTETEDGQISTEASGGVFFVGTELTEKWKGYMEGALVSGKRGAKQAIVALQSGDSRL